MIFATSSIQGFLLNKFIFYFVDFPFPFNYHTYDGYYDVTRFSKDQVLQPDKNQQCSVAVDASDDLMFPGNKNGSFRSIFHIFNLQSPIDLFLCCWMFSQRKSFKVNYQIFSLIGTSSNIAFWRQVRTFFFRRTNSTTTSSEFFIKSFIFFSLCLTLELTIWCNFLFKPAANV